MRILPRPTWVLSVIAFLVFATILVVDGTVRGGVGVPPNKPAEKPSVQQVPFVVTHGQQVVEARTTPVQTFALKKATVALTFDGGPQPERTAELLARAPALPRPGHVLHRRLGRHPEPGLAEGDRGQRLGDGHPHVQHAGAHVVLGRPGSSGRPR